MSHGVTITVDDDLEALIEIARRAGEHVMARYPDVLAERVAVALKGPGDPVTEIDREVERQLLAALAARFPRTPVVAEESAPVDAKALADVLAAPLVLFVDPIDGTRELIDGTGQFAVMIGLAEGGRPTAGVVALPVEGAVLAARVGQRALLEDGRGERSLLAVSTERTFGPARLLVSRTRPPPIARPLCRRLGMAAPAAFGSVGLKVSKLARGEAELYVHDGPGLKLWDTCAPEAILVAAGGRLTDLDGALVDYRRAGLELGHGLVGSNGILHAGVMSAVGWARREAERLGRAAGGGPDRSESDD